MNKEYKICRLCKKKKELWEFHKNGTGGYTSRCASCINAKARATNKELAKIAKEAKKAELANPTKSKPELKTKWHNPSIHLPKTGKRILCKAKVSAGITPIFAYYKGNDIFYGGRFFKTEGIKEWRYV